MAKKFHDLNWRAKATDPDTGETTDILETDGAVTMFTMILENSKFPPKAWEVTTDTGRTMKVLVES